MTRRILAPTLVFLLLALVPVAQAALSAEQQKALDEAKYIYVQSERRSGEWSKASEIWFFTEHGTVYVATRPTSWRVRRLKSGRTKVRISIGSADGPAFEAKGHLLKDGAIERRLMDAYEKKYPDAWGKHEVAFRDGFANGDRVLVAYEPL